MAIPVELARSERQNPVTQFANILLNTASDIRSQLHANGSWETNDKEISFALALEDVVHLHLCATLRSMHYEISNITAFHTLGGEECTRLQAHNWLFNESTGRARDRLRYIRMQYILQNGAEIGMDMLLSRLGIDYDYSELLEYAKSSTKLPIELRKEYPTLVVPDIEASLMTNYNLRDQTHEHMLRLNYGKDFLYQLQQMHIVNGIPTPH